MPSRSNEIEIDLLRCAIREAECRAALHDAKAATYRARALLLEQEIAERLAEHYTEN